MNAGERKIFIYEASSTHYNSERHGWEQWADQQTKL